MKRSWDSPPTAEDVSPPSRFPPRWMRRPEVPSGHQVDGTRWGVVGILGGGAVTAATLVAGHPYFGATPLGRWRIAGIAVGLVMVAVGLAAVLRHGALRATIKGVVVAAIVTAVGAFALGVEYIPTTLPSCATVFGPTHVDQSTRYCEEGNGTLVRKSISNVEECPDGSFSYTITVERRGANVSGNGWSAEWIQGNNCAL